MKFTIALLAIVSAVMAAPSNLVRRDMEKRQEFVIDTEQASMTTVKGDVVPFDTANVNLQGAPQS